MILFREKSCELVPVNQRLESQTSINGELDKIRHSITSNFERVGYMFHTEI
jgi:hypothetical protein